MLTMFVLPPDQPPLKMSRFIHAILSILGLAFLIVSSPVKVEAAPFNREFTFSMPGGQSIVLHGHGDEFSAIFETLDGYTVVYDLPSRSYQFAIRGANGRLIAAGPVAGVDNPAAAGIARHVRPDSALARADRLARRRAWEEQTGISKHWEELKSLRRVRETMPQLSDKDSAPPSSTTIGNKIGLTLLIDFSDDPATIAKSEVENFLNADNYTGFGNNGSVKTYFYENSAGRLIYTNVVIGYIRAPNPKPYYDNPNYENGPASRALLRDAIAVMKSWPNYDSQIRPLLDSLTVNAYNRVVACNVFYAGSCNSPWARGLWPCASMIGGTELWLGGKMIDSFQISYVGSFLDVGTFCHENGHMLCGFPDVYDYDQDSIGGAGAFCLMGHGGSRTNIGAYLKYAAGWATNVIDITTATQTCSLPAAGGPGGNVMLRFKNPVAPGTEYFLVENRQASDRDASIPASGIAVWHIDELGNRDDQRTTWNTRHENYECSLEQADNLYHFQNGQNTGDSRDLFYIGNSATGYANAFQDGSAPSALWWIGAPSGLSLTDFSPSGATMTVTAKNLTATPAITRFSINNNATITYLRDVTLHSTCTGIATYYQASESPDFAAAQWNPYSPNTPFRIDSSGGGDKTVYFKIKNEFGETRVISDTITLGSSTPEGLGTTARPYEIRDLSHLVWMSDTVTSSSGKHYLLMNDLDATVGWFADFKPIGYDNTSFEGTFDGAGGKITGLTINRPSELCLGLFGSVGTSGRIKNLMLQGGAVVGTYDIGTLVGSNAGIVENCCATCAVTASSDRGGGLVGSNIGTVQNCWAMGAVAGGGSVGGIVGYNYRNILHSYATGPVAGMYAGGLVGRNIGTVQDSYWDKNTTGMSTSAGSASAFGKTTAEMKLLATFAQWDFLSIWGISAGINGGYPYLRMLTDKPAVLSLQINSGATSTVNRDVILHNNSAFAPRYYMASESPTFDGGTWEPYSAMPNFSVTSSGNGGKVIYFKVKNTAGESPTTSDSIVLNEMSIASFSINNGVDSTASRGVTLNNIIIGEPIFYMASESSAFAGARWLDYSGAPAFSIASGGNGIKTIFLKVKNADGESSPVSDTIMLNEPIRNITLSGGLEFGNTVVGSTSLRTLTIGNSADSNAALHVGSIDYPTGFTGNQISGTIQPGSSVNVLITFAPTEYRDYDGTITLSADQTGGDAAIHVSGRGVGLVGTVNRVGCTVVHNDLMAGRMLYTDRTYVFHDPVPSAFFKKTYIRTAQSMRDLTTANLMTFTLSQPAMVYIAIDQRIITPPAWLASWAKFSSELATSDAGSPSRDIYYKYFASGPVTLGPNRDKVMPTGRSMYTVIVAPPFTGVEARGLDFYK